MKFCVFNIETVPDSNLPDSLKPTLDDFDAPANYKDPEKILAAKKEKMAEAEQKMSLSPLTGRVVCYSEIIGDTNETFEKLLTLATPTSSEEEIVRHFFDMLNVVINDSGIVIGYNSKSFDIPFMMMKLLQYGIHVDSGLLLLDLTNKYSNSLHFDVYSYLSALGSMPKGKLAQWGERLGCANKVFGAGNMVGQWYSAGDIESIVSHCQSNVLVTRELAGKIFLTKTPEGLGLREE